MATAVLTMVYNEKEFVPLWRGYYGSQFSEENIYIIDHGSSDGSLEDVGRCSVLKIPRTPKDNAQRSSLIRDIVSGLLAYYDSVIHVDVDEFLVVDPRIASSLKVYCDNLPHSVVTSFGINIIQYSDEADIELNRPILGQRRWGRFVSPMCKPSITSKRVVYSDGFHGCDVAPVFGGVYLLHLRYFDRKLGLERLDRTRKMQWATEKAGSHQRVEDEKWIGFMDRFAKIPKGPELFSAEADKMFGELGNRFVRESEVDRRGIYRMPIPQFDSSRSIRIPDTLLGAF